MFDPSTLALFALACLALAVTPGPDMLLIASRSAAQGIGAGFASLAGIQAGTYCHALAAALGLSQLFVMVPMAYDVVRYAGAVYLLYLAWQTLRATSDAAVRRDAKSFSLATIFRQGLLTNLLNPKMALFVLALFPQFVRPENGFVAAQILVMATMLNMIGLVVNGAVILAASRLRGATAGNAYFQRFSRYLLATVFGGLAVRLAFDHRR